MGKDAKLAIVIGGGLVIMAGAYFLGDDDAKRSIPLDSGEPIVANAPDSTPEQPDSTVINAPDPVERDPISENLPPADAFESQRPDDYSILDAALPDEGEIANNEADESLQDDGDPADDGPGHLADVDRNTDRQGVSLAAVANDEASDQIPDDRDPSSTNEGNDASSRNEATEIDSDPELVEPVDDEPALASNQPQQQDESDDGLRVETHTVRLDDTLIKLARMYYGSDRYLEFLRDANPQIKDPDHLQLGTRVKLPPLPENQRQRASAGKNKPRSNSTKRDRSTATTDSREYVVKLDDTFYAIASRELGSGARWKEIYELNKAVVGNNPDRLIPGQVLILPARN